MEKEKSKRKHTCHWSFLTFAKALLTFTTWVTVIGYGILRLAKIAIPCLWEHKCQVSTVKLKTWVKRSIMSKSIAHQMAWKYQTNSEISHIFWFSGIKTISVALLNMCIIMIVCIPQFSQVQQHRASSTYSVNCSK